MLLGSSGDTDDGTVTPSEGVTVDPGRKVSEDRRQTGKKGEHNMDVVSYNEESDPDNKAAIISWSIKLNSNDQSTQLSSRITRL